MLASDTKETTAAIGKSALQPESEFWASPVMLLAIAVGSLLPLVAISLCLLLCRRRCLGERQQPPVTRLRLREEPYDGYLSATEIWHCEHPNNTLITAAGPQSLLPHCQDKAIINNHLTVPADSQNLAGYTTPSLVYTIVDRG